MSLHLTCKNNAMEKHDCNRRLGSYTVNAAMVKDLHDFIQHRVKRLLSYHLTDAEMDEHMSMVLVSDDHAQVFTPASRWPTGDFPGDAEELIVEFAHVEREKDFASGREMSRAVVITVAVGCERDENYLQIAVKDQDAKAKCQLLEKELLSTIQRYANRHNVIYKNEVIAPVLFLVAALAASVVYVSSQPVLRCLMAVVSGIGFYLVAYRFFYGYCSFDSTHQRRLNAMFKLVTGVIAVGVLVIFWGSISGTRVFQY